jgi:hypothetical protein
MKRSLVSVMLLFSCYSPLVMAEQGPSSAGAKQIDAQFEKLFATLFGPMQQTEDLSKIKYVDVFGTDKKTADEILSIFGKDVQRVTKQFYKLAHENAQAKEIAGALDSAYIEIETMKSQIARRWHLDYVNFDTIGYGKGEAYTTIEVLNYANLSQLSLVSAGQNIDRGLHQEGSKDAQDIILQMQNHIEFVARYLLQSDVMPGELHCPVHHCLLDFDREETKPYLEKFNQGMKTQKEYIVHTLYNDKDHHRREAAAFLLGHLEDSQELINILTNVAEHDPSVKVRNAALRVIGEAIKGVKDYNLEIAVFLKLLKSPAVLDRNKSLIVINNAVSLERYKNIVLQQGVSNLLDLLALKQPNNHLLAYEILKTISSKNYSDKDLAAWRSWSNFS